MSMLERCMARHEQANQRGTGKVGFVGQGFHRAWYASQRARRAG